MNMLACPRCRALVEMGGRDVVSYPTLGGARRRPYPDFTQMMLGPLCTQTLADFGADDHVERSGKGEWMRVRR